MTKRDGRIRAAAILACPLLLAIGFGSGPLNAADQAFRKASSHIVVVPDSPAARKALADADARQIAVYDAFTLVRASRADTRRLVAAGGEVRDDMQEIRIGRSSSDPVRNRRALQAPFRAVGDDNVGLAVVQYVGPLQDEWIAAVQATGVQIVSYMAQNGQLVSGDGGALAALSNLVGTQPFIRAVTPYVAADKLVMDPANDKRLRTFQRAGEADFVISTVAGKGGESARATLAGLSRPRGNAVPVAGIVQHRVVMDASQMDAVAALGGVVAVEPLIVPELHDERAAMIVDGKLDASFQPILGKGHRNFLKKHGLANTSPVIIDITDEGVDVGIVPQPAGAHPDFFKTGDSAKPGRLVYAQEATVDADARDCGGHGSNVASIATGYNRAAGAAVEDAQGFNFGMGIQPFGKLGATKIFNCTGNFDVQTSLTALHSAAYGQGARISNNSWGSNALGAYTAFSQEFDALVRDAQPGAGGSQQFTEVFSAGNSGPGTNTIGAPGTAKNVITVGASESVRLLGFTDGCGVTDLESDSARDIVDFSSRGPTDDLRIKPDVVAPGTHLAGAQPQTGASYNGNNTCNPQFPAGSTLYSLVSGTSQAAPEVTGLSSLVHTWFRDTLGNGRYPSPAMTKAMLINTATDLFGGNNGAGGSNTNVPNDIQGWGRVNLGTIVDGTDRQAVDQSARLAKSGAVDDYFTSVASGGGRVRVTLVWTDPPGPTTGNAFVNDLDLEVVAGGILYKGNVFTGGLSVPGGSADPRNNVENIFLPDDVDGPLKVSVIARNIAGDGVPGNSDTTDQDYALVISHVTNLVASLPVLTAASSESIPITGDGDNFVEPGETFRFEQGLQNVGSATATAVSGTLAASGSDAVVLQAVRPWPNIAAGDTESNSPRFEVRVKPGFTCGSPLHMTLDVTGSGGTALTLPVDVQIGQAISQISAGDSVDVPKAIPDNLPAGITSDLALTGNGTVTDMTVTIGQLTHTFDGDLTIEIVSPTGKRVSLFNRRGGAGDNLTNTVFSDAAAAAIGSGVAPFTGSFRPETPLAAMVGEPAEGTWKLAVVDTAGADVGTLQSWGASVSRRDFVCD